ncbi:MAG: ribbon-helix-helix domain-containing protein [Xanthobacteraceae bacterium]|jgi:predicted DNA-binding ribbon-helix-helix protein
MKSPVVKRSIVIAGHKTSVSLEDEFWSGLKEIATNRNMTLSDIVSTIDSGRQHGNLSSAIRLFVLDHYRANGTRAAPASANGDIAPASSSHETELAPAMRVG